MCIWTNTRSIARKIRSRRGTPRICSRCLRDRDEAVGSLLLHALFSFTVIFIIQGIHSSKGPGNLILVAGRALIKVNLFKYWIMHLPSYSPDIAYFSYALRKHHSRRSQPSPAHTSPLLLIYQVLRSKGSTVRPIGNI